MNNEPNKKNGAKPAVAQKKKFCSAAPPPAGGPWWWELRGRGGGSPSPPPPPPTPPHKGPGDYTYDSAAYTSRGLSIVSAEDKTVNLKISGDGYTIGGLTASDFVVYPDFSSVRDSGEKRPCACWYAGANGLLNGVTVTMEGNDNTVDVVFDVVEEKDPARYHYHQLPDHRGRLYPL